jgi:hypothetical protein
MSATGVRRADSSHPIIFFGKHQNWKKEGNIQKSSYQILKVFLEK